MSEQERETAERGEPAVMLSVVLSFRNEAEVIPELVGRLKGVLEAIPVRFELIFVNDDSSDDSLRVLLCEREKTPQVKVVNMSRRFGVAECVLAGMEYARGDAVVYMDADLQDPPELIPELYAKWRSGADVVYTVRTRRAVEPLLKLAATGIAYRIIRFASPVGLPSEAGDFRLVSRRVVRELLKLRETRPYLRGLVSWVGFEQAAVPYERLARAGGETHFPLLRNALQDLVALRGPIGTLTIALTSFSILPLVAFLLAGLLLLGAGAAGLLVLGALALAGEPAGGTAPLIACLVLLSGLNLTALGTVGLYVGRIFQDVQGRPLYIVKDTVGLDDRHAAT